MAEAFDGLFDEPAAGAQPFDSLFEGEEAFDGLFDEAPTGAERRAAPEALAAEVQRKATGKRMPLDALKPKETKLPPGYSTPDDDLWLGESDGVVKDAVLGGLGAFSSMIPFTPRDANPAFGESGPLATTANILGGVGRGVATAVPASLTPAGPWGGAAALAGDRAYQISTEREGGLTESVRKHPWATGADIASSGISNLIPGGAAAKPLVANAANSLVQGASEAIGEGAGGWDAAKAGVRTALLGSILPLAHAGVRYRPEPLPTSSDDAVDFRAVSRAEQEVEAEMTPAELHGYPLLPYKQRQGREINYGDKAGGALFTEAESPAPRPLRLTYSKPAGRHIDYGPLQTPYTPVKFDSAPALESALAYMDLKRTADEARRAAEVPTAPTRSIKEIKAELEPARLRAIEASDAYQNNVVGGMKRDSAATKTFEDQMMEASLKYEALQNELSNAQDYAKHAKKLAKQPPEPTPPQEGPEPIDIEEPPPSLPDVRAEGSSYASQKTRQYVPNFTHKPALPSKATPEGPRPPTEAESRIAAIRYGKFRAHKPNFTLGKEAPTNVVSDAGFQGQAGRPQEVAPQASPTGVESQVIRSGSGPSGAPGQADAQSVANVRDKIVMEGIKEKPTIGDMGNVVLTEVFDKDRPFLLADRAAKKLGAELAPTQESYKSMRGLNRRIVGKVKDLAERGWTDDDGNAITPSLREVFSGVKPERMKDFATFMVARRAPEMAAKQQKLPFSLYDAENTVRQLGAEFKDAADRYDAVMSGALDYAAKKGFFSPEQVTAIREQNMFYTPWERVDDAGNIIQSAGGGNKKRAGTPLKKATSEGSERAISDPFQTSVGNLSRLIAAVERNESKRVFADLANIPGMEDFVKPISGSGKDFAMKSGNVIELKRNGETESYQVSPQVAKTLEALSSEEGNLLTSVLKWQADIQRAGVVLDPAFAANNLLRDAWQQAAVSRTTSIPFANQTRGLAMLATKEGRKAAREWARGAGNQSIEYSAIFDPEAALKSFTGKDKNALLRAVRNPLGALRSIMSAAESVSRIGEYGRAKSQAQKAGMSAADAKAEAEFQAADLMDFSMKGRNQLVQNLRRYVPFFGANLSGMYREGGVLRNPTKLAKAVGVLGGMEALNYLANQDDPEYWNEPNWKRFAFWRIPTKELFGWETNLWLPKPPGILNYGITAPIKTGLETFRQQDPKAAEKNAVEVLRNIGVNYVPPIAKVPLELMRGEHGFSDFMNREIVPKKLQGLPKRLQFTGRTTEASKAMSRGLESAGLGEWSPIKMDYAVQGLLGPLPKRGLELLNPLLAPKGSKSAEAGLKGALHGFGESTIRRNFAMPGVFGSEVQDRFFETLEQTEQEAAAKKAGQKARIDVSRLKAMRQANERASELRAVMGKTDDEQRRLAIQRQIDRLYAPFVKMPASYKR